MNKVNFSETLQNYIDNYDGENYRVWNTTEGLVAEIRKEIRDHYKREQRYKCCYCRQQNLQDHGLVWDCEHILPKAIYPTFLFEPFNLALSCKECNQAKEKYKNELIKVFCSIYSLKSEDYRIIHPHFDTYSDHIEISSLNGTIIFKVLENSEKGKFTYICCNFIRYEKKLVGYSEVNNNVALTINKLLEGGIAMEDILEGLLNKDTPIHMEIDF